MRDTGIRWEGGPYKGWLVRLCPEDYLRSLDLMKLGAPIRSEVERTLRWWDEGLNAPSDHADNDGARV